MQNMNQVPYQGQWFNYAQPQQQFNHVLNNFLSPEAISSLQKNTSFVSKLTTDEYNKAVCTHKLNNEFALKPMGDKHHCNACQEDFHLIDLNTPMETINAMVEQVYDLIQSSKAYMIQTPKEFESLYMITGLIKKIPQLWEAAKKSFEQGFGQTSFNGTKSQTSNPFATISNIFGGIAGFYNPNQFYNPYQQQSPYQQQQPMMQQPYAPVNQQPMYQYQQQQPMQQYGYPNQQQQPVPPPGYVQQQPMMQQPGSNPIGYIAQQPMNSQQVQIPVNNPGQSVPVQQPQPQQVNPNIQNPNIINATPPTNTNINK